MSEIIIPLIFSLSLIGIFIYLRKKTKKVTTNITLVVEEKDKINYSPQKSTLTIFETALLNEINEHRKNLWRKNKK